MSKITPLIRCIHEPTAPTTMRKLILKMQCSLDGFVGGPKGELDWIFASFDAEFEVRESERLWHAGAHLMGKATYGDMAAHWPTSTEAYAPPMNQIPKIVFSHSLQTTPWVNPNRNGRPAKRDPSAETGARSGPHGALPRSICPSAGSHRRD